MQDIALEELGLNVISLLHVTEYRHTLLQDLKMFSSLLMMKSNAILCNDNVTQSIKWYLL